jgi:hypothetical protein
LVVDVQQATNSKLLAVEAVDGTDLHPLPITFNFISGERTTVGSQVHVSARAMRLQVPVSVAEADIELADRTGAQLELVLPSILVDFDAGNGGDTDAGEPDAGRPAELGWPCQSAFECGSNLCVDGVCCDSSCEGACNRCNLPSSPGHCTVTDAASAGAPPCAPYACNGTSAACPANCMSDWGCTGGFYCQLSTQVCAQKKTNGQVCDGSNECLSDQCIDGFCCNNNCPGACDACNTSGSEGTCTVQPSSAAGAPTCSPYLCSGASPSCATSCSADAWCSGSTYCVAPACEPLKANGSLCGDARECSSHSCVDGYCCNSACTGPCDQCDRAGLLGVCSFSSGTDVGSPSCAPYNCAGSSAACAANCTADGGCAPRVLCSSTGICMTKLATFSDHFNDNVLSANWQLTQTGLATLTEQSTRLQVVTSAVDAGYAAVLSASPYDALESSETIKVSSAGNQALASLEVVFGLRRNPLDRVAFIIKGNVLNVQAMLDGGPSTLASRAYSGALMRYLRISESSGSTSFSYSADGGTNFVLFTTIPDRFFMGEVYPELGAGTTTPELSSTTVLFDVFN